ncbi:hypothetical protein NQ176_g5255 [Zarea fungicola]|uniref:Uncharacterized protein n=1 Tax=Zarea fungicola TaxID=93591 RepID=A0ACC1NA97_9HYPO|nr:hypothetical protein NQ176_g5255 [Lecanicillium fungicola]
MAAATSRKTAATQATVMPVAKRLTQAPSVSSTDLAEQGLMVVSTMRPGSTTVSLLASTKDTVRVLSSQDVATREDLVNALQVNECVPFASQLACESCQSISRGQTCKDEHLLQCKQEKCTVQCPADLESKEEDVDGDLEACIAKNCKPGPRPVIGKKERECAAIQCKAELSAQKPVEEAVGKCKTCTEEQCGEALEGDEACVAEICGSACFVPQASCGPCKRFAEQKCSKSGQDATQCVQETCKTHCVSEEQQCQVCLDLATPSCRNDKDRICQLSQCQVFCGAKEDKCNLCKAQALLYRCADEQLDGRTTSECLQDVCVRSTTQSLDGCVSLARRLALMTT